MRKLFFFGCAITLTSCATTKQSAIFRSPMENPTEGKSTVCVIRPKTTFGSMVGSYITIDGKTVGKVGHANYICWESEPGNHTLSAKAENTGNLQVNFAPDKKYYYKLDYSMGVWKARVNLVEIDSNEFSQYQVDSKRGN